MEMNIYRTTSSRPSFSGGLFFWDSGKKLFDEKVSALSEKKQKRILQEADEFHKELKNTDYTVTVGEDKIHKTFSVIVYDKDFKGVAAKTGGNSMLDRLGLVSPLKFFKKTFYKAVEKNPTQDAVMMVLRKKL